MYVNGKQIPLEGLTMDTGHEKTTVFDYRTPFEGPDIHHSNTGLQITHDVFITGYFLLLFDLTPDQSPSDGRTSLSENGNIRIELKLTPYTPWPSLASYTSNTTVIFGQINCETSQSTANGHLANLVCITQPDHVSRSLSFRSSTTLTFRHRASCI